MSTSTFLRFLCLALSLGSPSAGSQPPAFDFGAADRDNGEEINEVCAGCHGEFGQGGKEGEYPRLAGLPAAYIAEQLILFRERARSNLAMVEYVDHRQMPDPEIRDIAAYLAAIELPSRLPPVDETAPGFNAYERLLAAKRVVQIPSAPGDPEAGKRLYRRECRSCHGTRGQGKARQGIPPLAGQYTAYLWRQIEHYRAGRRIHDESDPEDEVLMDFTPEQLRDILAYLSRLDD